MPLQNRVTPYGEIISAPWRGMLTGNRGCLHDDQGQLGVRRWRHQNWVCCVTEFRGRKRDPMPPGRWTALFFWDEAVALTAGHRPCGECRYRDYHRFLDAWRSADLPGEGPRQVDRHLHANRVTRRREQVRHVAASADLPNGTFVDAGLPGRLACLIWNEQIYTLLPEDGGYHAAGAPPKKVPVLTPRPMVAVLRAGYTPDVRLEFSTG